MKKIVLLLLIVLTIPVFVVSYDGTGVPLPGCNYPDLPKDKKWEFFRERVFSKTDGNKSDFNKYNGPILVKLYNATKKDSLVFNDLFQELRRLIPDKFIGYYKNYTELDLIYKTNDESIVNGYKIEDLKRFTIPFYFKEGIGKYTVVTNNDSQYLYMERSKPVSGYNKPEVGFRFSTDLDDLERKQRIQFEFIRLIGIANFFKDSRRTVNSESSILNEGRMGAFENQDFTDLDKFFIQKLYDSNTMKAMKSYMYETYPWRFVSNYFGKSKTKVLAIWICVSLAIILFWIGFGLLYKKNIKNQFLAYFLSVLFIMITVLYVYKLYIYITVPSSFEDWRQYIAIHILFVIVGAIIALFLMLFDRFFIKNNMSFTMQLVLKVGFTFFVCLSPVVVIYLLENNHNARWFQLNPFLLVVFAFSVGRGLLLYLDNFSENLVKQKDVELNQLKERNAQAQVQLLQSQINPHFLYNALNSIASLASVDSKKTQKMAHSLSHLFKYSINRNSEKMNKVSDEVTMVKTYLEIEQIRFGDRLTFKIDVDETLEANEIPKFIIQPLVENAVKHGVSQIEERGVVSLSIKKVSNGIEIQVKDNGPHFPDDLISGHGLQTVYDLLQLTYGNKASLNWQNEPEKAITILIP
ncbi:sensor histidine kinase [Thalassobellus citreus]|uniref:sensor histidine kinase n=1 Tax=Thalassobellus citreus TaxID=3367752 RepID=UPI0037A2B6A8